VLALLLTNTSHTSCLTPAANVLVVYLSVARSCLELLVCVLALLLVSSTYSEQQLAALQSASPSAIEASGRFSLLKALCMEARVDYGKAKVRGLVVQMECLCIKVHLRVCVWEGGGG
jgi:hypothetical protein